MREYCAGIKVKPIDRKQIIHLEFYIKEPTFFGEEKIKIVSAVTVPYEIFKKFFIIRRACYSGIYSKKIGVKKLKSEKDVGYVI